MSEVSSVSSLPLPPAQYISLYAEENERRGRPPGPPAPRPAHDTYTMFGNTFNADDTIIRSLESQVMYMTFHFTILDHLICIRPDWHNLSII